MSSSWQDPAVRILDGTGGVVGTGLVVRTPQVGLAVLTAAHVVNKALRGPDLNNPRRGIVSPQRPKDTELVAFDLVGKADGRRHVGRVVEWAPPWRKGDGIGREVCDVALLEVATDSPRLPASIAYPRAEDFVVAELDALRRLRLHCYGYPDEKGVGRVAHLTVQDELQNGTLQITASDDEGQFITKGFSGTAVFVMPMQGALSRKVVGIVVAREEDLAQRVAFVVPTRQLWRACPQLARPYRGLRSFGEGDSEFFFGREAFVEAMLSKVRKHPIVGVTAASGAGKSSAIGAGLLPRLKAQGAVVLTMRPSSDPWERLAAALVPWLYPNDQPGEQDARVASKSEELRADPSTLRRNAATIVCITGAERLLIVVDQFEELFTLAGHDRQAEGTGAADETPPTLRGDFRELMVATAQLKGTLKLQWLYALRADFAGQAFRHPLFKEAVSEGNEFLPDMKPDELREAIGRPAAELGVRFEGGMDTEPGLVERIARDAGATMGSLPLMQHVLDQLWEGMRDRCLTHKAYEALGKVTGALDRHADAVFAALPEDRQRLVPRLFSRLVNLKDDGEATRRVARRDELDPALWTVAVQLATAVEQENDDPLESRLLVLSTVNGRNGAAAFTSSEGMNDLIVETVEVAHEALLRNWIILKQWLQEDTSFILWRQRLSDRMRDASHAVSNKSESEGALIRGGLLEIALYWASQRSNDLTDAERSFIYASRDERDREQAREERRREELEGALASIASLHSEASRQQQLAASLRLFSRRTLIITIVFSFISLIGSGLLAVSLLRGSVEDQFDQVLAIYLSIIVGQFGAQVDSEPNIDLDEPRFVLPFYGWYWSIIQQKTREVILTSESLAGDVIDIPEEVYTTPPGRLFAASVVAPTGHLVRLAARRVAYEDGQWYIIAVTGDYATIAGIVDRVRSRLLIFSALCIFVVGIILTALWWRRN